MTSFKDVKAGDRVRLTRDNGDDLTFTVEESGEHGVYGAAHNSFYANEGWNVEILQKPLPTGEYAVIGYPGPDDKGYVPYIRQSGEWWEVDLEGPVVIASDEKQIRYMMEHHGFKVLYEGIEP